MWRQISLERSDSSQDQADLVWCDAMIVQSEDDKVIVQGSEDAVAVGFR